MGNRVVSISHFFREMTWFVQFNSQCQIKMILMVGMVAFLKCSVPIH